MTEPESNACVTLIAPRSAVLQQAPTPEPAAREVKIRTAYSGISAGTEMNVYRGVAPQWRRRQDPATGLFSEDTPEWTYPLVYGYANVGTVEEVGREVESISEGDVVFSYRPHCAVVVEDANAVIVLPELPDVRRGVFLANLNTALNGVLDARPALGDVVVVSGLGVIGLLVTHLVRQAGAGLIVGIDPIPKRRSLALEAGANHAMSPTEPVADVVRRLTGGRGADIVLEVSGAASALNEAIRLVGFGGQVVAMSWYGGSFESLSLAGEFHHNRVRIRSSPGRRRQPRPRTTLVDRAPHLARPGATQRATTRAVHHPRVPARASPRRLRTTRQSRRERSPMRLQIRNAVKIAAHA